MSLQAAPTTAELTELRFRLYRPEPPAGAVERYLRALLAAVPSPPAPVEPPERTPRRGLLRVLCAAGACAAFAGLVLLLAAALGSSARATAAAARPAAAHLELPPVPGVPIGSAAGSRGATVGMDGRASRVVVSLNCSGSGTLALRIADEPPTELVCERGTALAMLTSTEVLDRFTVGVDPDGAVRWSLAAGAVHLPAAGPATG